MNLPEAIPLFFYLVGFTYLGIAMSFFLFSSR